MANESIFRVGDRVQLSALGIARSPKIKAQNGVVIAVSKFHAYAIGIVFDGNKAPTTLHRSYLELETPGKGSRRIERGLKAKVK
jgi:hypothetical protein